MSCCFFQIVFFLGYEFIFILSHRIHGTCKFGKWVSIYLGDGNSKLFSPLGKWSNLTNTYIICFKMGWFNHQLDTIVPWMRRSQIHVAFATSVRDTGTQPEGMMEWWKCHRFLVRRYILKTKGKAKGEVILKGFFLYLFIGFMMKSWWKMWFLSFLLKPDRYGDDLSKVLAAVVIKKFTEFYSSILTLYDPDQPWL